MASDGQGTIYIPLEDFWQFVKEHAPEGVCDGECVFGVPRVRRDGMDLEIDYAFSNDTECHPKDWSTKPPAVTQWEKVSE